MRVDSHYSGTLDMPSSHRLSVGMPVYNGAKWIRESVEHLLSQSFGDFELIIADNGSTDDTESICRELADRDSRVRYYRHSTNIGVFKNYDRVFELSSAEYFKWASCNDICLDGFLEKCVAVLDARPDVVLVYPKAILIFAPPGEEAYGEEYEDNLNLEHERPSQRFTEYLNRERLNNVMNGVIRVPALRQTALNRPLPGSDISMIAELSLRGKFVEIPDRLFVRRLTPETTILLMDQSSSGSEGYLGRPDNLQRLKLHSYRFVTALRAPIGLHEKLCVWLYLLRRIAWLRHRALHKLKRLMTGGR
jgi:glycosyltransferase involved in cell wall biosynthesis